MKTKIKIAILSVLGSAWLIGALVFLLLFIPTIILNVQMDYAENHYEITTEKHKEGTYGWIHYGNVSVGCGETSCKYCEGEKIHSGLSVSSIDKHEFVYYSTLENIKTAFNVLKTIVFLIDIGTAVALIVFAIKYVFKKKSISQ